MSTRGERIRQALAARGVAKQQALAAELKVHESAISRWKEGKPISLDSAVALGTALDISLDWLLLGRATMDAHRGYVSDDAIHRIGTRIGPRSFSLLLAAIESIVADAASKGSRSA